jgi:hypothetical protein
MVPSGRVGGDSGQVRAASAVFDDDQRVDASQGDRVDLHEVHREEGFGLLGEELFPSLDRVAAPDRSHSGVQDCHTVGDAI